jgi:hypothetical protein
VQPVHAVHLYAMEGCTLKWSLGAVGTEVGNDINQTFEDNQYRKHFHTTKATFDSLHQFIAPYIQRNDTMALNASRVIDSRRRGLNY